MNLKAITKYVASVLFCSMLIGTTVHAGRIYDVPTNSSFKSYMSVETITSVNSRQYKLQQQCVTNELGLRVYNGYYTIAIGTGFNASVGDYVNVTLSSGNVLHCIVGDIKQARHTDPSGKQASNGNVVEFIVDVPSLSSEVRSQGNVSYYEGFEGDVVSIEVVDSTMINQDDNVQQQSQKYLVVDKYCTDLPSGEKLYTVEYAYGSDFNSIICSEEYYSTVEVGTTVISLK